MTRRVAALSLLLAVCVALGAYFYGRGNGSGSAFHTSPVERGALTAMVTTTGTLNAVTTVLVGTEVSGQVRELLADFNSKVKRNQVIARIAPESFEAVKAAMAAAGFAPLQAEVTMRAENDIAVTGDTALQVKKMLDMLEDLDDVQNVYSNADLGDVAYQ